MTNTDDILGVTLSSRGKQLVKKPNGYYAVYYRNGKRALHNLDTKDLGVAQDRRATLFMELVDQGAVYRQPRSHQEKAKDKPNRYIYYREPWLVRVGKKLVGTASTKKEAQALLDNYLNQ